MENGYTHSSIQPSSSSTSMLPPSNTAEDPPEAPPLVFQHNYLGNLTDVQSGTIAPHLQSGQVYDLPVLPLEGVVMVPGTTVPLSVNLHGVCHPPHTKRKHPTTHRPRPTLGPRRPWGASEPSHSRLRGAHPHGWHNTLCTVCCTMHHLLCVAWAAVWKCADTHTPHIHSVGCIMELTQQTQDAEQRDDTCYLARGLRRVSLGGANGFGGRQPLVPCTVLPPESPLAMPREAADERCHLPAWACRMYDCNTLAHEVCEVLQHVAPSMQPTEVDPLQLSYWLLRTLPLECAARQNLLEMDCVAQRLQAELDVLRGMSSLYCILCRYEVRPASVAYIVGVTMLDTGGQAG